MTTNFDIVATVTLLQTSKRPISLAGMLAEQSRDAGQECEQQQNALFQLDKASCVAPCDCS